MECGKEAPAIGIDFGTTNSCAAIWRGGKIDIILNSEKESLTPSLVRFGTNTCYVGSDKGNVCVANEIFNTKCLIGHDFNEIKEMTIDWPLVFINDGKGRPMHQVQFQGETREFYPEQICALILKKMKKDAEGWLGLSVKKAVITVPAYFSDTQKQAIKVAAELAGLNIINILVEPVAATIAFGYGAGIKDERNVVVYDLGK